MEFFAWLLVGAVLGIAAGYVRTRRGSVTLAVDAVVGVVGALMGGAVLLPLIGALLERWAGVKNVFMNGFDVVSIIEAVVGAAVLYFVVVAVSPKEKGSRAGA